MKNFEFIPICFFLFVIHNLNAQLNSHFDGMSLGVGVENPEATAHLYGAGIFGAGTRLIFGDDQANGGIRCYVGEFGWQSNQDTDNLELHGSGGITFTYGTNSSSTPKSIEINNLGNITFFEELKIDQLSLQPSFNEALVVDGDGNVAKRDISGFGLQVASEDVANSRFGVRTSTPDYTFDLVHAVGSPIANQSTNGLNIRNEGTNMENWTMYVDNALGDLDFFNNGVKEISFTNDGSINFLSDARSKKNISDIDKSLVQNFIQLKAKQYIYKHSKSAKMSYGFLAQEVEKIFPNHVSHSIDDSGSESYSINYIGFIGQDLIKKYKR